MNDIKIAFTALLISSCMALLFVCALAIQKRPASKVSAVLLALTGICAVIYNFGYAMEINGETLSNIMFWVRFQHFGIQLLPAFWLMFALHVMGKRKHVTLPIVVLMFLPPLIGLACSQTLGGLNLLHPHPRLATGEVVSLFVYDRGWPIYIVTIIQSIYIAVTFIIFTIGLILGAPLPRKQTLIYWVGSALPWVSSLAYNFGLVPYNIDPTPLVLSFCVILLLYGVLRVDSKESKS